MLNLEAPKILTAIPQRRYRFGHYSAVVLGEIESGDEISYRYILALVREGDTKPSCYVMAEKNPRERAQKGRYRLRVISENFTEDMGSSDRWGEIEPFVTDALAVAGNALGIAEEQAVRLM
jgi:hypothetical protein